MSKLFLFAAPSGAGKTTIVRHLLNRYENLSFSTSATTRPKRPHETDGKDYYFITPEQFRTLVKDNGFVEWEEVYEGNFYGTLKEEVQRIWDSGRSVIFDVDVKGGLKLKRYFGDDALAVFVKVPSLEVLEERLTNRNSESSSSLSQRLYKAKFEMTFEEEFDLTLINEDLVTSLKKAEDMVTGFIGI